MSLTLVVLAAGMGSRYGGIKQLQPVGNCGEILMDYSFFDAIRAGFDKIVCVIRKDIESDFCRLVTKKWEKQADIHHVFQEIDMIDKYPRKKPWGTGHAVLCAQEKVNSPFVVINADDFYGATSYTMMANFLKQNPNSFAMVAFELGKTLSKNGSVSRGICSVKNSFLQTVKERSKIFVEDVQQQNELTKDTPVSMNFWGFPPSIFEHIQQLFSKFLAETPNPQQDEFYIPSVIDYLINNKVTDVKVLFSEEQWLGITYPQDLAYVQQQIQQLISSGIFPSPLLH
ncbi:nucleotidyltransferase family protein [Candidatus Uabimicrobium amorphum]|uniref:Nucleotidyltransferase n=1 Tax=Uabimicrobium amorphum TaxID=2596890 RepID=A0A5S9F6W8_UABAM|nr:sugar phosphate nucleotidyltransferase [Candidatus Uabimicrobium amorphum]BBM87811.1 nucleotidyltransferase [Candidatus Uabimicrobium amorphum]